MKIILFILFNLVTTYNTYAYTCSEIINTSKFNDIKFRFYNARQQLLNEIKKTKLGIVEYYNFDNGSGYYKVDTLFVIKSCISFKSGTVIFKYEDIIVLAITSNGFIDERHVKDEWEDLI